MLDYGLHNMDCMDGMAGYPDGYFDLAICDPPYGQNIHKMNFTKSGAIKVGKKCVAKRHDFRNKADWDNNRPDAAYFTELFRVSKQQIIWGGNYFADMLPPSKGFIVWDKRVLPNMTNDYADCEMAWCSIGVARMFRYLYNGMLQGDMKNREERVHPTQKPVVLYTWLLDRYARQGNIILDTHVGSASSLIACEMRGYQYVGFEIDPNYYRMAQNRIAEYRRRDVVYNDSMQVQQALQERFDIG